MSSGAKKYVSSIIVLSFIALAGFIPVKVITVSTTDGAVRFVRTVHDGDTVVLSHINSIYDAKVEEVLQVKGSDLCLVEVRTDSYGVKEYYGITEGITPRSWREIRFYNSAARHFSLAVNGKKLDIGEFTDSLLSVGLKKTFLYRYFGLLIF